MHHDIRLSHSLISKKVKRRGGGGGGRVRDRQAEKKGDNAEGEMGRNILKDNALTLSSPDT